MTSVVKDTGIPDFDVVNEPLLGKIRHQIVDRIVDEYLSHTFPFGLPKLVHDLFEKDSVRFARTFNRSVYTGYSSKL